MNVKAAIIGMGIGKKHLEAIDHYKNSEVKVICEKDPKKIKSLKIKLLQIKKTIFLKVMKST